MSEVKSGENADDSSLVQTLFAGGSLLLLGLVIEVGISFLVKVVIARYLGKVQFGAISLGMTVMTISATVLLVGLHTGVGRFLPRYETPRERNGVIFSAFQIVVPLSILCGLVLALSSSWIAKEVFSDPSLYPVLLIFTVGIPFNVIMRLSVGTVQGTQRALPRVYIQNFLLPGSRLLFILLVVVAGLSTLGIAVATVAAYVVTASLGLYYVRESISKFSSEGYEPMHGDLLAFSFPLLISSAMLLIFSEVDTLLLGYFGSTGDIGVYKAVYPIAILLLVVLRSFQFLFMPKISELHANDATSEMAAAYQLITKWVFVTTVPIFFVLVLFPTQIINILFGAEYIAGAATLSVLCLGFVSHTILGPNGTTLTSLGKTRLIMYDNILAATLNIILNILLIPTYSIFGAAIATAAAYIFINFLYSYQLFRETGILPIGRQLLPMYLLSGGLVVSAYIMKVEYLESGMWAAVVLIATFAAIYSVTVLRYGGVGEDELELLDYVEERMGLDVEIFRDIVRYFN